MDNIYAVYGIGHDIYDIYCSTAIYINTVFVLYTCLGVCVSHRIVCIDWILVSFFWDCSWLDYGGSPLRQEGGHRRHYIYEIEKIENMCK